SDHRPLGRGKATPSAFPGFGYRSIAAPEWFCQSPQGQGEGSICPVRLPSDAQADVRARYTTEANAEGAIWGAGGRFAVPVQDSRAEKEAPAWLVAPSG